MNTTPITSPVVELQEQFRLCVEWNDPDQWVALAMLYYQRGYALNALHCFKRAEDCQVLVAAETE